MQKQIQVVRFPQAERTNSHKQKTSLHPSRKHKPAPKLRETSLLPSRMTSCSQAKRCNTAQKSPIRRKKIIASPVGAKAPLAIPKLWRSYSVASYIPFPLRGKGAWG